MGIETAYTISEKGPQMTGYVINAYSGERKSKYSLEDSVEGAIRHVITAPIFRKHDFQSVMTLTLSHDKKVARTQF